MGGERLELELAELCSYINRGSAPAYTEDNGILVLNQKCVRDQRVNFSLARRTDPQKKKIANERMLRPFDILVNSTGIGTLGRVAQVLNLPEPATVDSHVTILRPNQEVVDPHYLGYVLRRFERSLEKLGEGSTGQTELSRTRLAAFTVPISPDRDEQRAIAHILSTLDDKIELNRQMNETLEAMAQAIFKSWFVDFDPVVVNAIKAGNPIPDKFAERAAHYRTDPDSLGLPDHILRLFPDRFVDSGLGPIPEGWEVGRLGDVIEIHDRKRIPLNSRERAKRKGPYPYYGASGIMDYVDDYLFDGIYILLGEDGTVIDKNNHPAVQYVWGQFWVNNHAHVLSGTSGVSSEHLYLMLRRTNVRPFVTGAVQPKISQTNLKRIPIILSNGEVRTLFSEIIKPLFSKYRQNSEEINILENARDALLPKLISGELRVPNVEKVLEGAK